MLPFRVVFGKSCVLLLLDGPSSSDCDVGVIFVQVAEQQAAAERASGAVTSPDEIMDAPLVKRIVRMLQNSSSKVRVLTHAQYILVVLTLFKFRSPEFNCDLNFFCAHA